MKKVAIVFLRRYTGGNLVYTLELINFFAKNSDYQCTVLCSKKNSEILDELKILVRKKVYLKPDNIIWSIVTDFVLFKVSSFKDFNFVIFPNSLLPFVKPKGANVVTIVHDLNFLEFTQGKFKDLYKRALYKYAAKHSDILVYISRFTQDAFINFNQKYKSKLDQDHKSTVIWNGVNPIIKNDNLILPLSRRQSYVITFAHQAHKNSEEAIRIFSKLQKEYYNLEIYVIGSGEYAEKIQNYYINNKRVIFVSNINKEELNKLYSNALFLFFLSSYEGFGLPVFEAFSAGTPVVISKQEALLEISDKHSYIHTDINHTVTYLSNLMKDESAYNGISIKNYNYAKQFTWENQFTELSGLLTEKSLSS
jgi:mannosyltransferase